jgi:hypothetical protein
MACSERILRARADAKAREIREDDPCLNRDRSSRSWRNGFQWNAQGGGWEYPAFWGLIVLAILLGGGGPWSLDRRIGREL